MEINVLNYLSESEIKSICEDEIRNHVRNSFSEKDLERIISNSAYYKVFGIVDNLLPNGYEEKVVEQVEKIIDSMTDYSLFRFSYGDRRPESKGALILEKAVEDRKQDIINKINEIIDLKLNGENEEFYIQFQEKLSDALWNGFSIKFEKDR